jgi:hypothetical protein
MRVLADENVPGDVVAALVERGHDVAWVRMDSPGRGTHTTFPYSRLPAPLHIPGRRVIIKQRTIRRVTE